MVKYFVVIKHDSQKLPNVLVWFYFLIRLTILLSGPNHTQQHGFYQKLVPKGWDKLTQMHMRQWFQSVDPWWKRNNILGRRWSRDSILSFNSRSIQMDKRKGWGGVSGQTWLTRTSKYSNSTNRIRRRTQIFEANEGRRGSRKLFSKVQLIWVFDFCKWDTKIDHKRNLAWRYSGPGQQ